MPRQRNSKFGNDSKDTASLASQLAEMSTQVSGGGAGILKYDTLEALQSAHPNGLNVPVWVSSANAWAYWNGTVTQPADITAPTLTITVGGTFTGTKSVTMSANETATIYYTLDGSTPTTSSSVYSSALSISATTILKAFAKDTAGNSSSVQTVTYTLDTGGGDTTAPVLTITPAVTFTDTQTVTMSVNEASIIWYTLDDSDPTTSGTRVQYTSPLTLTTTDTVKAYAVDTAGNASAVQTITYTKSSLPAGYIAQEDFSTYADGAITGKSKWQLVEGTSANVTSGVLNVDATWNTVGKKHGLQFNEVRTNGVYKVLVKGGSKIMFGWHKAEGSLNKWVIWKNSDTATKQYQFGTVLDTSATARTNVSFTDATLDHWIEVTMGGGNVGDTIAIRIWNTNESRPTTASYTYTITGSDPVLTSGEFVFNSFDSTSFGIKQFIVTNLGV
jgi:hypothetical protein